MIWYLEDWQEPCYNINNGRCKSIIRWKNRKNIIYEETTNNIIPILSIKRPHSRAFHLSAFLILATFMILYHPISLDIIKFSINNDIRSKDNNEILNNLRYNSIYLYLGSSFFRITAGLFADIYGIRIIY